VKPVVRLKEFTDKVPSVQQKALMNPCDNFSMAYQSMCDLFAVEFMEDVAWVSRMFVMFFATVCYF